MTFFESLKMTLELSKIQKKSIGTTKSFDNEAKTLSFSSPNSMGKPFVSSTEYVPGRSNKLCFGT